MACLLPPFFYGLSGYVLSAANMQAQGSNEPSTGHVDLEDYIDISDKDLREFSQFSEFDNRDARSDSQVDSFITAPSRRHRSLVLPSLHTPTNRQYSAFSAFPTSYFRIFEPLDTSVEKAIAIGSATLAVVAGLPLPIIGYIFGQIVNDFPPENNILHERIIQLLAVAVGYFVVTTSYTVGFGLTAENVSVKLRKKLLDCLIYMDQAYLDTHDVDINGLLTEKIDTIRAGCSEKVGIFIQSVSYFVAAAAVGFVLNAKLTGILLASVVPAFVLCFFCLSPAVSRNTRAASEENGKANGIVEATLRAIRVVQAFDMAGELCRRHLIHIEASTEASTKKSAFIAVQSGSAYFVSYSANALAFYLGSRFASNGNAGSVYAVVFLILDASFIVGQFSPFLEIFARAQAADCQVRDLLDEQKATANSGTYSGGILKPDLRAQDIELRNVVFQYPTRPNINILDGISMKFCSGKFHSIVGASGGGKSTLVALLLGTYDHVGQIQFGEYDVRSIDPAYLRSRIAVVEQDAVLFTGSILDNVCFGLGSQDIPADERTMRCMQALRDANVDFLDRLPNGIHTRIGNELQLSGGQQQRICLARALIKQPVLLVLDEPTSSLDAGSEAAVMRAIDAVAASGTTVLMIAHRLSTTLNADKVFVVSGGQVIEQGTPQELAQEGTTFRSLLDAQSTNLDTRIRAQPVVTAPETTSPSEKASSKTSDETFQRQPAKMATWALAKRTAKLIRPEARLVVLGLLTSIIGGGILLGQVFVFGNLIQLLNMSRESPAFYEHADFFCLVFFILALVAFASYAASGTAFGATSTIMAGRVQTCMLRKLLFLDVTWFSQPGHSIHELLGAFSKDPADLSALGGVALGSIFAVLTSLLGSIILAHIVAWKIALVLLPAVPVMMLCGYARLRLLTVAETKHREAYSGPTSIAAEAFRNRRTVTALCMESHILQQYQRALREPHRQIRSFIVGSSTLLAFCFSTTYFVYALAYWWGSRQVRNGTYSTTQFFIVLPALLFSSQSAGQIFSLSAEIARAKTAAQSIFGLLDTQAGPTDLSPETSSAKTSVSSRVSVPHGAEIEFRNVSLLYPGSKQLSLDDMSLKIERGQTVAFVGPSGAGKSSAIALIERFYDATSGFVLLDGVDVRDLDSRALRAHIGLVTQDSSLFPGTIGYNVRLGAAPGQTIDTEDIEAACRKCALHDFIVSLPEGYNTECGSDSSSRLSGGQKQRLTIARALVRNPNVLLLDEPTSALDAHSEAHVQKALSEAAAGRTTVMVAHRLASIRHVDKIYVFEHGRVVEHGTHAELMEQNGLYASMAKTQSLA